MDNESCYQLGYLAKIHGLQGELKAIFEADDPEKYLELESVFVYVHKKLIPFFIEKIRHAGNHFIIKFEDVDLPEDAQGMIGCTLHLPLDLLPALPPEEFYYHEIIGFKGIDTNYGPIGTIADYYSNGPQDLLALVYEGKEILIPVVREFISIIDKKNKVITFNLPEGLVDLYLSP